MNPEVSAEIAAFFYPVLVAVLGFFLVQFYLMVKKLNDKSSEILIELAKIGVRESNIVDRIEWLEQELERLKEIVNQKFK